MSRAVNRLVAERLREAADLLEQQQAGRWGRLDRLRGTLEPETLFRSVAGIGPELARRIHDSLHVDTLEALEIAAHDGRLASVRGREAECRARDEARGKIAAAPA